MVQKKRDLPLKSEDVSEWYNKVVLQAELADYGPVKGTMIYRPYGYAIWELIQKEMDARIKDRGVSNAYFPLFIPEALLKKEEKHVEGFSPELAVVTIGGGEELSEKVVVRPTSETIMYDAFARWVHSWRDLPLMINQWNNVVRWEKRTYLFFRTTEFLWQEGHTAHATHDESWEMTNWGINMYADVYKKLFALPGYMGQKSESEKFAGADASLTYEMLMPGGKALQGCTSHDLGQNFSKSFGIEFQTKDGKNEHVWQTSWGFSTRSIGAVIMAHGDDGGLRLPPNLAPIQVVVIPVKPEVELIAYAEKIEDALKAKGVRIHIDDGDNSTLGAKINHWELRGVPIRIELGGREVEQGTVTLVRRDTGEKSSCTLADLEATVAKLLTDIQQNLYAEAEKFLMTNTRSADSYDEFKRILENDRGFIKAHWCESDECEKKIKEETKATTRCLPIDAQPEMGTCVYCGKEAGYRWLFAQAY
ncbi:MAG: proline--tRNA ligase [Patescibacteria group bacterium]